MSETNIKTNTMVSTKWTYHKEWSASSYFIFLKILFQLKKLLGDFQNSPPFERSACFYVTIMGNFERFQYFNFETNFLENENLFQKTGVLFFS